MIAWLRRLFAHRTPDPELEQHRAHRAEQSAKATSTASRAHAVAKTVVNDSGSAQMRRSFARTQRRLAGRG